MNSENWLAPRRVTASRPQWALSHWAHLSLNKALVCTYSRANKKIFGRWYVSGPNLAIPSLKVLVVVEFNLLSIASKSSDIRSCYQSICLRERAQIFACYVSNASRGRTCGFWGASRVVGFPAMASTPPWDTSH